MRELDKLLIHICTTYPVKHYLEIGTREGHSLITVATNARHLESVTCIDNWSNLYGGTGRGNPNHILALAKQYGLSDKITIISQDSKIALQELTNTYDLILVDGDHSYFGCHTDMRLSFPLLTNNGLMVVDDLTHPAHPHLSECFINFCTNTPTALMLESQHVGLLQKRVRYAAE